MFQAGEYVIYGSNGVCRVNEITFLNGMTGVDNRTQYYILSPVNSASSLIYSPVDNPRILMRRLISREEAEEILREVPSAETLSYANPRQTEEHYKAILSSCDSHEWMRLIKTLIFTKRKRQKAGRRITSRDERYLAVLEESLFSELAIATGREKAEIKKQFYDSVS